MGQGYSLTSLSAGSASINVPELSDLVHEKSLGMARFMKSIRARHAQGRVFVKAFVKPYPSFDLRKYLTVITGEREALTDIPNALPYQRILETANGGFLARQYIHSSLYDRLSTRPFLEDMEKKWLAFQLLCALRDCHARDVYHGDIKSENLLVTSWNWLYLTDFSSSFKPTYLPEDNPADFSFYFDTSGRRTCYLAPERFVGTGDNQTEVAINWAMDIFSAGCVIAELFLEGPIFTLSQLFRYRKGDMRLEHTRLNEIRDNDVRELIQHMIRLEPESRYAAEEILRFWRGKVFPEYFYGFLHQYMALLTDFSSGREPVVLERNSKEPDERIERIYTDFDKISYFLGYVQQYDQTQNALPKSLPDRAMPMQLDTNREMHTNAGLQAEVDRGTLIFLAVVVSSLRNTSKAAARLKACDLLLAFGQRLPDEIKLDRILPYVVVLLSDDSDLVKIAALRTMTHLLATVEVVSPVNAYVFPEYIFPGLRPFMLNAGYRPNPIVRAAYASYLASLARSSARILDMMQAIKVDGRLPELAENDWVSEATFHGLFDVARVDLVSHFEEATKALMADPHPSVRRAFLGSVSTLCVFFGSSKASDVVLSHLNTYLNDQDWILKCAFFEVLVGVAAFVGVANLERFTLPLMVQSLTDRESFVVERVIRSLANMAEIGLFQKATLWEILSIVVRFLVHPSIWVREAAAHFIASCGQQVSAADRYCIVLPLLQSFLRTPMLELSQYQILDSLKKPLSRPVLDMAMLWATKVDKGLFWKNATRDAVFVSPEPDSPNRSIPSGRQFPSRLPASQRNEEDEQWIAKLRGLGMHNDDEVKLLALREYIWRVAHRKADASDSAVQNKLNNIMSLSQIDVTPQNIFFDNKEPLRAVKDASRRRQSHAGGDRRPHTIADALLDASTIVDAPGTGQGSRSKDSTPQETADHPQPRQIVKSKSNLNLASSPSSKSPSVPQVPSKASPPGQLGRNWSGALSTTAPADGEFGMPTEESLSDRKTPSGHLHHRLSGINLLNRKDTSKAGAAIATTSEIAFGRLDGPILQRRVADPSSLSRAAVIPKSPRSGSAGETAEPDYELNHSYMGSNQNILRLLDNHFVENFPTDLFHFGKARPALDAKSRIPRVTDSVQLATGVNAADNVTINSGPWHPVGHLLTMFSEHTAAVNAVIPAPDHAFFVTASDDGTCKIWDTTRLEKNVTPRSRQTYKHPTSLGLQALCFIENTHAFACAAEDGSIHIVKIDYKKVDGGDSTRYGKLDVVRGYQIPTTNEGPSEVGGASESRHPERAICMLHYRTTNSQSVLLLLTNRSRVLAVDLKTMDTIYILTNSLTHGSPTTFVVDKKRNWLLVGTSHGVLDLWDLRFRLHIRSWALKSGHRIQKICLHPTRGKGKWIMVAAGSEISVWDLEKQSCKEVYRPEPATLQLPSSTASPSSIPSRPTTVTSMKAYEPWFPDEESQGKVFQRFTSHLSENGSLVDPKETAAARMIHPNAQHKVGSSENTITALYAGYDNIHNPSSPQEPVKAPFLISGGLDRTLRFWELTRPENSSVISGLQSNPDDSSATAKPKYEVSHPGGQIMLVSESLPSTASSAGSSSPGSAKTAQDSGSRGGHPKDATTSSSSGLGSKPPRSTIISKQQQSLLRNHFDGITDCCVLNRPYGMVVSVDRGGGVFIFR